MNQSIGLQLIFYSLALLVLSWFAHHLAPSIARVTLIAGMVGGVVCMVWGVRALLGSGGRALPILTLIPMVFVMLSQTVLAWGGEAAGQRAGAMVVTALFVLSLGMLMRIAYAGVVPDVRAGETARDGSAPSPAPKAPSSSR